MVKLCMLNKMKREQGLAYNEWKTKKAEIAALQKQIRKLEADKKRLVEIFDEVFTKDCAALGPGGVKVIKSVDHVDVAAFSYDKVSYKEG